MKILEFIKGLIPTFSKNEVKNKIRVLISRIEEYTIHSCTLASQVENGVDVRKSPSYSIFAANPKNKRELEQLYRLTPARFPNDLLSIIVFALRNSSTALSESQANLEARLPDLIHTEGVTYATANVLRFVDIVDFTNSYASKFCYVLSMEAATPTFKVTPAERKYLEENATAFIEALKMLVTERGTLVATLFSAKEVLVEETSSVGGPLPTQDTDPLRMSLIPVMTPVFGRIGMAIVDWEIRRAEKLQLERRAVEHAMERARQNEAGIPDARAEKIMYGWARELETIERKIARLEGK